MDLALAWGPVAAPEVLSRLDFHLSRRYASYRWRGSPPLDPGAIAIHVANNHLIPASEEVVKLYFKILWKTIFVVLKKEGAY